MTNEEIGAAALLGSGGLIGGGVAAKKRSTRKKSEAVQAEAARAKAERRAMWQRAEEVAREHGERFGWDAERQAIETANFFRRGLR